MNHGDSASWSQRERADERRRRREGGAGGLVACVASITRHARALASGRAYILWRTSAASEKL